MPGNFEVMTMAATANPEKAQALYTGMLGLTLLEDTPLRAIVEGRRHHHLAPESARSRLANFHCHRLKSPGHAGGRARPRRTRRHIRTLLFLQQYAVGIWAALKAPRFHGSRIQTATSYPWLSSLT